MKKDLFNNIGVSVIIPMYNSENTIIHTLNSVINQTYKNIDIIVIDDSSSDNSYKIVSEFIIKFSNVRLFKNRINKGVYFSRNRGIKLSFYNFIAFLDSDDLFDGCKIERQLEFMVLNDYNFTFTGYYRCDSNYKVYNKVSPPLLVSRSFLYHNTVIATSTVMYNKNYFLNVFFKDVYYDDFVFWLDLLKTTNAYCLDYPLTYYRISTNSLSGNKFKSAYKVFQIFVKLENSLFFGFYNFIIWLNNSVFKYLFEYKIYNK